MSNLVILAPMIRCQEVDHLTEHHLKLSGFLGELTETRYGLVAQGLRSHYDTVAIVHFFSSH